MRNLLSQVAEALVGPDEADGTDEPAEGDPDDAEDDGPDLLRECPECGRVYLSETAHECSTCGRETVSAVTGSAEE